VLVHDLFFVPFKVNSKAAESLADPAEYPNLFEDWQIALNVEATVAPKRYLLVLMVLCII
jgi:coatomer subunit beta'